MSDHAQHPVDYLPELALGVLPEAEAAPVRAALEECPECRDEFALLKSVVDLLPAVADDLEPPEEVRTALLQRIADERDAEVQTIAEAEPENVVRPARWRWFGAAAAAAAVVAAIGAGIIGFVIGGTGSDETGREQAVVDAAARGDLLVADFVDGDITTTLVRAPGESDAFIWVENLPPLPAGKTYQAWFTRDLQDFEPAETFSTAEGGEWLTADAEIDAYVAMGLTIEADGGAEAPTSAPFVVVDLQKSARAREVPPFMAR